MANKSKRIKKAKDRSEDQVEILGFIKILVILIVIILGIYLLTRLFVSKDLLDKDDEQEVIAGEINYDATLIGNMFNKVDEEYYVIMYDTEDINAVYYSGLISYYTDQEEHLKIYFADLNNPLNQKFVSPDEVNVKTNDLSKFKVGDVALIKIVKGKVTKALTTEEDITNELKPSEE